MKNGVPSTGVRIVKNWPVKPRSGLWNIKSANRGVSKAFSRLSTDNSSCNGSGLGRVRPVGTRMVESAAAKKLNFIEVFGLIERRFGHE